MVVVAARRDKEWLAATTNWNVFDHVMLLPDEKRYFPAMGARRGRGLKGKSEIVAVLSTSEVDNVIYEELESLQPTETTSFFTVRSVVF